MDEWMDGMVIDFFYLYSSSSLVDIVAIVFHTESEDELNGWIEELNSLSKI